MTKMDMAWVAVASLLHPRTGADVFVRKEQIDTRVSKLFDASIPPVLITHDLVNSVDRQADRADPVAEVAATDICSGAMEEDIACIRALTAPQMGGRKAAGRTQRQEKSIQTTSIYWNGMSRIIFRNECGDDE